MARTDALILTSVLIALLSFVLLTFAITSDYWSILEVENHGDLSGPKLLSSHSGLWCTCEGQKCVTLTDPFVNQGSDVSPTVQNLLLLHQIILVVFFMSLFIKTGCIIGLVSSLLQNIHLFVFTGCCFLLGGALTLAGVVIYIRYSHLALAELYDTEHMQDVRLTFGPSLTLACVSLASEVLSGALVLLAACLSLTQHQDVPHSGII